MSAKGMRTTGGSTRSRSAGCIYMSFVLMSWGRFSYVCSLSVDVVHFLLWFSCCLLNEMLVCAPEFCGLEDDFSAFATMLSCGLAALYTAPCFRASLAATQHNIHVLFCFAFLEHCLLFSAPVIKQAASFARPTIFYSRSIQQITGKIMQFYVHHKTRICMKALATLPLYLTCSCPDFLDA